jgi:hypothetical protein
VQIFRLTNEAGGLGLSCTPAGVSLAGVPLLRSTPAGFVPRPASEIASLLKAAYGADADRSPLHSRLGAIAQALSRGDSGLAAIAAVHTRTPELGPAAAMRLANAERELTKYNYNHDEPRDWHGRWTTGGVAALASITAPEIESDQAGDPRALDHRQRVAENPTPSAVTTLSDATAGGASEKPDDGDDSTEPTSLEQTFEQKYDHLGPVDFAKETIQFGDWLGREGRSLSPAAMAHALAEYSFLQDRLSFWLNYEEKPPAAQGNLLSAALTLYQGAVLGGFVRPGRLPESMLAVAGTASLFSGGPPRRASQSPPLEDAPAASAQAPKVEGLGGIGEAEKPVQITLRGVEHTMPDWHMEKISYTKRTGAAVKALRAQFEPVREAFVKDLAENHTAALRDAGISDENIATMAEGDVPRGYQVHHKLPLDDGGTNATSNLILIRTDPDHQLITNYQNEQTRGMSSGWTRKLEWPMPDSRLRIWPKTPDGGAYPSVHKVEWSMPDSGERIWPKIPDGGAYPHRAVTRRARMSDIDDLLAAIEARERKFGCMIRPPATPEAIERLRRFARDTLRTDLPEGYLTFLGRNDGLDFNSYVIYAATEQKKPFLSGFVEANERLGRPEGRYVYYGESGIDLYAQDRTSTAWVTLDRPSLSVMDTFPSFDAMLTQVLRDAVAKYGS